MCKGCKGTKSISAEFKVRRGVIQRDIISPIFFILVMEQIFHVHDDPSPAGTTLGNYLHVGVLGYADDTAIVSHSAELMTERLSNIISRGSRTDTDMEIHKDKTKNMHVERQQKLKPPSISDIKQTEASYKHGIKCKTSI